MTSKWHIDPSLLLFVSTEGRKFHKLKIMGSKSLVYKIRREPNHTIVINERSKVQLSLKYYLI